MFFAGLFAGGIATCIRWVMDYKNGLMDSGKNKLGGLEKKISDNCPEENEEIS